MPSDTVGCRQIRSDTVFTSHRSKKKHMEMGEISRPSRALPSGMRLLPLLALLELAHSYEEVSDEQDIV